MSLPGNEENLIGVLFFFFLHSLLCDIQYPFSKNVSGVAYLGITLTIIKILSLSFGVSKAAFSELLLIRATVSFHKTYSGLGESF